MQKCHVTKTFGVPVDGGLLEGLQVWFSLHHLDVVVAFWALIQDSQADGALEGPRQLPVIGSLHGVDKEGDVVGTALGIWRLQVEAHAQFIAWAAGEEAGAVLHDWQTGLLVPEQGRKFFEAPDVDPGRMI